MLQRRRIAIDENLCKQGKLICLVAKEACWRGQKTRHYNETFERRIRQDETSLVPEIQV